MKLKWRLAQALCLVIDACCIWGFVRRKAKPVLGLTALHYIEWLMFGRRVGKLAGISSFRSFFMSMLFGISWWLPQNELTHLQIESGVNQRRFETKACGISLQEYTEENKE